MAFNFRGGLLGQMQGRQMARSGQNPFAGSTVGNVQQGGVGTAQPQSLLHEQSAEWNANRLANPAMSGFDERGVFTRSGGNMAQQIGLGGYGSQPGNTGVTGIGAYGGPSPQLPAYGMANGQPQQGGIGALDMRAVQANPQGFQRQMQQAQMQQPNSWMGQLGGQMGGMMGMQRRQPQMPMQQVAMYGGR